MKAAALVLGGGAVAFAAGYALGYGLGLLVVSAG